MRKIKTFNLFESVDTDEVLSVVKDMLLELDDSDFTTSCVLTQPSAYSIKTKKWTVKRTCIKITISKPAIRLEGEFDYRRPSFSWDDIKVVMDDIFDFLESEGFKYNRNHDGYRHGYQGSSFDTDNFDGVTDRVPRIEMKNFILRGADDIRTFCELHFEKI